MKPPNFKKVHIKSDASDMEVFIAMTKNLRRGFGGLEDWLIVVKRIGLSNLSLRHLISVSDTFFENGKDRERCVCGIITTFATMVRISDSFKRGKKLDSIELYDGTTVISKDCDTLPNLFFRIEDLLEEGFLRELWVEIKDRLSKHSNLLRELDSAHSFGIYSTPHYKQHLIKK